MSAVPPRSPGPIPVTELEPRLTIAIPLHGGAKWIEGILDTVAKAPEWSRVVLSDATHLDDAVESLAGACRGDDRVEAISRPETLGWVDHANLLLEEAQTDYFCWMPQDDLVSPEEYFELLVAALDENPDRILAFPTVLRELEVGRLRQRSIGEVPYQSPPFELGEEPPELEAVRMLREWNMALGCWRGVFRTRLARPIPQTDDCADVAWTFSMALEGNFIGVEQARYLKRFHGKNAHHSMRWQGMPEALEVFRAEVEARIGQDPVPAGQVMAAVRRYLHRHRLAMFGYRLRPFAAYLLNRPRPVTE